jgi:hypothetical protein
MVVTIIFLGVLWTLALIGTIWGKHAYREPFEAHPENLARRWTDADDRQFRLYANEVSPS